MVVHVINQKLQGTTQTLFNVTTCLNVNLKQEKGELMSLRRLENSEK